MPFKYNYDLCIPVCSSCLSFVRNFLFVHSFAKTQKYFLCFRNFATNQNFIFVFYYFFLYIVWSILLLSISKTFFHQWFKNYFLKTFLILFEKTFFIIILFLAILSIKDLYLDFYLKFKKILYYFYLYFYILCYFILFIIIKWYLYY